VNPLLSKLAPPSQGLGEADLLNMNKKLNEYFEDYLSFRAREGNVSKTLLEHKRFLYGPVNRAVGDKTIDELRISDRASLIEAGKPHGAHGSQRSVVTFKQLCRFINQEGIRLPFDWREVSTPKVPGKLLDYLTI
jgi:hypothetical protein